MRSTPTPNTCSPPPWSGADWNNSTIIPDDPVAAANELKHQDGRDLILYGHGRPSQTLLEHHLLDEIRFAVHPLLLTGRAAGRGNGQIPPLKLIAENPLPSGVVALLPARPQLNRISQAGPQPAGPQR